MIISPHQLDWIEPDWPAPQQVRAVVSTRAGNLSPVPYDGFNTADHVGAPVENVETCRRVFQQVLNIRATPQWLDQVHGTEVVEASADGNLLTADACFTTQPGAVLTLHTADCLPVFFCDQEGSQVAMAHAGWRGLASGVLENTVDTFHAEKDQILCWLGPAISQKYFEVGAEVKAQFEKSQSIPAGAFKSSGRVSEAGEHYLCDLYLLAKARLNQAGVGGVYGGGFCTYSDPRFFSYRRQHQTGRILSAMWLNPSL